jgi:hypothetical protein
VIAGTHTTAYLQSIYMYMFISMRSCNRLQERIRQLTSALAYVLQAIAGTHTAAYISINMRPEGGVA